jgi:spermidine/putrescine transport system substrate-binding protein
VPREIDRRTFLRTAGLGAAALALVGCRDGRRPAPPPVDWAGWWRGQEPTGQLTFANWPYYIDRTRTGSHPSLDRFSASTGTAVEYVRAIRGNAPFLEKIEPALRAGEPTGYDIIVMTNGLEFSRLLFEDWLTPLDPSRMSSFHQHAGPSVRSPSWDPGNQYTMAWQSGLTGLAFRPEATEALGRPPDRVADLWDPALAGHVGMMADLMDLGSVGLLRLGIAPDASFPPDWTLAANELRRQADAGIVRAYYDQEYVGAIKSGDVWLTQAWSGDIYQLRLEGFVEIEFTMPREGGVQWTDNMAIPKGAEHPADAMALMDFVYHPNIAAMIADWVGYVSPVPEAADLVADRYGDLEAAQSPLLFPTDDEMAAFQTYPRFEDSEHEALWRSTFQAVVDGH